jgi:cytochrome c
MRIDVIGWQGLPAGCQADVGRFTIQAGIDVPTTRRIEVNLRFAVVASLLMGISFGASAQSAEEKLAQSKNCLACHQVDTKLVGPAYKDVAAKYKDDPAALDKLVKKVRAGGSGVWGQIPMPPNPQVSEAEAKTLVSWILAMKK